MIVYVVNSESTVDGDNVVYIAKFPQMILRRVMAFLMHLGHVHSRLNWNAVFGPSAIQTAIRLHAEGKCSLHKELKMKRREQRERRERRREEKEQELQHLHLLQEERERKSAELELLKEAQKQAQLLLEQEEKRRREQHEQLQQALELQLKEAQEVVRKCGIPFNCVVQR